MKKVGKTMRRSFAKTSGICSLIKNPLLYVILFSTAMRVSYGNLWPGYVYHATGDSPDYVIHALSELSWIHRMPLYQLLIWLVGKLVGSAGESAVFTVLIRIQMFSGIVSCGVFYQIGKKLFLRNWLAAAVALVYAAQPHLVYYEKTVLTEALGVHMMVTWTYLLICYLESRKNVLALGIGLFTLFMTLMRPSFVVLYPILALFWGMRVLFEKEKVRILLWGIGSLALSTACLLIYCYHNQTLTGRFMLSCVSYDNQLSILIENEIYENIEFPEITETIRTDLQGKDNSLKIARNVFEQYGYDDGVVYLQKTIRQNFSQYMKCLYSKWTEHKRELISDKSWQKYTSGQRADLAGKIQILLMPFSFRLTLFLCLAALVMGIVTWIRTKRVPYARLGFPTLNIAIILLSFGTLTHASPQRICVHMTPLVLLMVTGMLGQLLDQCMGQSKVKGEKH